MSEITTKPLNDTTVADAVVEAMETLAFVSAWPTDVRDEPADALLCAIEYTGARRGRLCMIAPQALGWTLAANVFGVDRADDEARQRGQDALREIMNVACGALCRRICPGAAVELNLPVCLPVRHSDWRTALDRSGVIVLEAEENILAIWTEELA